VTESFDSEVHEEEIKFICRSVKELSQGVSSRPQRSQVMEKTCCKACKG
jgi:hypothetical protein